MLDLAFVRDHLDLVEEKLRDRGMNPDAILNDFNSIDVERRAAITEAETLKAHRNKATEEIAQLKKNKQDATAQINETKDLREKIAEAEKIAEEADARLRNILLGIPNLPDDSVPVGKSEADNVEVRRWGTPPQFDFTPKPHWELGEELGVLDLERAAKITGARFAVYWDLGAKLERALMNFMLDLHTREHGYTEVLPPFLVNAESHVRHWKFAEVRSRSVQGAARRQESLSHSNRRSPSHQSLSRRDAGRRAPADLADRLHAVLSQRSRIVRQRCARHHSPAPISESRAGEVHQAGAVAGRAREADAQRRRRFCRSSGCTIA